MRRAAGALAIALAWAASAQAQVRRMPMPRPVPVQEGPPRRPAPPAIEDDARDLRGRFGLDRAARLLRSSDPDERLRGLERAAAIGSVEAIAMLASALADDRPSAPVDPRARIAIARGLAPHTDQANARQTLLTIVGAPRRTRDLDEPDAVPRFELARAIAAIALAGSHDARAVDALVALAKGSGGDAAMDALVAFPPSGATRAWSRPMTASALRLAQRTMDLRAIEPALEAARAGDAATRAAAIEALGAMGDARVAPIAIAALRDVDARMRAAGGGALAALGAPEAASAVEQLLADDATAARGIELAVDVHGPGVVRALAARAATAGDPAVRAAAIAALGRDAGREGVEALVAFARDPMLRADAADALARSPSDAAAGAIATLASAKDAPTRRLAARAYVVRAIVRGARSDAMDRALAALAASKDASDRAVAAFARVTLGDASLAPALVDRDAEVRRAAAMGALARLDDEGTRAALLDRAAHETDDATRRVLSAGLARGDAAARVPTGALLACARAGGADAALCALAFARRAEADDAPDGAAVDALLASRDPLIRAHAARGLSLGDDPTRAGRLAAAFAYEADAVVRRAIVLGLARCDRALPSVQAALATAARLDPDPAVRALASRAADGRPLASHDAGAHDVAWIHLVDEDGAPPPAGATGALLRADGLAVPIAFDADGDALVPGVPAGAARLVLAPRLDASYSGAR